MWGLGIDGGFRAVVGGHGFYIPKGTEDTLVFWLIYPNDTMICFFARHCPFCSFVCGFQGDGLEVNGSPYLM